MERETYGCTSQETQYNSIPSLDKSKEDEWHMWKICLNNKKKDILELMFEYMAYLQVVLFLCREIYEDILDSFKIRD